ncbi:MAG: DEAD/DEAH box helicase [Acidimicrobiales bacterium]
MTDAPIHPEEGVDPDDARPGDGALTAFVPDDPDPDALLDGFVSYVTETGLSLYEAQETAILELLAGDHVILTTPTGSGKSLVAMAAHYVALAQGRRSVYTAPIKALVSEKFFDLRHRFGVDQVGMITGDATINHDAPIICATAEILANWALRDGAAADVGVVIADEFHYYADPQRGWAWQVPLLELTNAQFLLMSATMGDPRFFQRDLEERTGRSAAVVSSTERPVPLDFSYHRTTVHQSVSDLLEHDQVPVYLVHFTQREASEAAQGYLSLDPLTKEEKARVREAIGEFRFDSPIGKDLRRLVMGGVGVHHAGLLPKYRLLVERLAQQGLLKIICGTDTLGVGVNVPIRTVLFTQLFKYDGTSTRILTNREFAQIAGRAGRKGYDSVGYVWAQDPPHVVDNLRAEAKAAGETGRKRKVVKRKAPDRGYAHWTEDTFNRLVSGTPEPLTSSFHVTHQMVMSLLDRPGDGCAAVRRLLTDNHETRRRQRHHIRRAIAIYRSLVEADLLEVLPEPDELGRRVRVTIDLQDTFALHQPLSLWAVEAIEQLAGQTAATDNGTDGPVVGTGTDVETGGGELDPDQYARAVLSVIESVLPSPRVIIAAQIDKAKQDLLAELKARGVEYEERMERLADVTHPKPNAEWIYYSFDRFRTRHPWVGGDNVAPKAVVRDLLERAMTFGEYVSHYGLKRSEGVVLRYLSDVYAALIQNIPDDNKTEEIDELVDWLGAVIRQVDSSLIDEWDRIRFPTAEGEAVRPPEDLDDVTANPRAFGVMVRNEAFRWVTELARNRLDALGLDPDEAELLDLALAEYRDEHDGILTDPGARGRDRFLHDPAAGTVIQILRDPDDSDEWRLVFTVDTDASRETGRAVLRLNALARAGEATLSG